jgi:hypothetical protein
VGVAGGEDGRGLAAKSLSLGWWVREYVWLIIHTHTSSSEQKIEGKDHLVNEHFALRVARVVPVFATGDGYWAGPLCHPNTSIR